LERSRRQPFRHHVGELLVCGHVDDAQLTKRHVFPDEVDV
jgi:hypothetical protein